MSIKISGLDEMMKQLDEAQRAFRSLDGSIATLKIDPTDPASIDAAIRRMESEIDRKACPYRNNPLVRNVIAEMKNHYRKAIRDRCKTQGI